MPNFQQGDEWLEFEQGGLHEERTDLLQEVNVVMPRLAMDGIPFTVAEIQKYVTKDGKTRWRSMTPRRDIFRSGYTSRERCAQELIRDCKAVADRVSYRKLRLRGDKHTPSM